MGIFLDFIKLSYQEKILALESLFWVTLVRVMIWMFPFSFVQKRVQKTANYLSPDDLDKVPTVNMNRIRMMIVIISRYIPGQLAWCRHWLAIYYFHDTDTTPS